MVKVKNLRAQGLRYSLKVPFPVFRYAAEFFSIRRFLSSFKSTVSDGSTFNARGGPPSGSTIRSSNIVPPLLDKSITHVGQQPFKLRLTATPVARGRMVELPEKTDGLDRSCWARGLLSLGSAPKPKTLQFRRWCQRDNKCG